MTAEFDNADMWGVNRECSRCRFERMKPQPGFEVEYVYDYARARMKTKVRVAGGSWITFYYLSPVCAC